MGRIYSVSAAFTVTNANGNYDYFELTPADDKPIRICGLILSQKSDVGDAQEEGLDFTVIRLPASVTSGSGGSSPTPQQLDDVEPAAGFTAEMGNSTVATTSGTAAQLADFAWNIRNSPYEMWWPEEKFRPMCRQGAVLVLRQNTSVADDVDISCTVYVEEI